MKRKIPQSSLKGIYKSDNERGMRRVYVIPRPFILRVTSVNEESARV
jgi:hypothetical protein